MDGVELGYPTAFLSPHPPGYLCAQSRRMPGEALRAPVLVWHPKAWQAGVVWLRRAGRN